MAFIGILLSHYWRPLALSALVAAALAYRAMLIHQRDDARNQVAQLNAETAALRTNNQALGSIIERQDAAVAELKARADAAVNTMAADETAAARAGAALQIQAQAKAHALMTAPIDAASGCEGAIRWGNARAAELSSW